MSQSNRLFIHGILFSLVTLGLDQLHKWYMLHVVDIANRPPIEVTPFLNFVMVWNEGISFGLFSQYEHSVTIFTYLPLLIVLFLGIWMKRSASKFEIYSLAAIIGGAVGNVIDRVLHGAVADFFDVHIMDQHWPAFNIADSAVFCGAVGICIYSLFYEKRQDKTESDEV